MLRTVETGIFYFGRVREKGEGCICVFGFLGTLAGGDGKADSWTNGSQESLRLAVCPASPCLSIHPQVLPRQSFGPGQPL